MFDERTRKWIKALVHRLAARLPGRPAVRLLYLIKFGRLPNLRHPTKFTELVQHRKVVDDDPRFVRLSDKILAKDHVASVLGDAWIIPTLWSGTALPPRGQRDWPLPYVIKANFGAGLNYFVRTEAEAKPSVVEALARKWLRSGYAPHLKEYYQERIAKRVLVEEYIGRGDTLPLDYKFYCFGGRVACILVMTGRGGELRTAVFSPSWDELDLEFTRVKPRPPPKPPLSLESMMRAAETLSADFPFVRIDFYEVDGVPKFGEFTFTPSSGLLRFKPRAYDAAFGALWLAADSRLKAKRMDAC